MRLPTAAIAAAILLALTIPAPSGAADAPAKQTSKAKHTQAKPAVDEKAAQALDRACKALAALKAYSFSADVTLDKVYQDGSKIQAARHMDVVVKKPGMFKVVTDGDEFNATSSFDGSTFMLSLSDRKLYGQISAPGDTDALLQTLSAKYGIESPLGDLLLNEPCAKMSYEAAYYVGKSKAGGASCDQLFFQGKDVDWQLWVDDSTGLPRRLVITEKKQPMAPQFTATLTGWKNLEPQAVQVSMAAPDGYTRDDGVITGANPAKGDKK